MSEVTTIWIKTDRPLLEVATRIAALLDGSETSSTEDTYSFASRSHMAPDTAMWRVTNSDYTIDERWPNPYDHYPILMRVGRHDREASPDEDAIWFVREIAPRLGWQAMTIRDNSPGLDLVWAPGHGHLELELSVPDLSGLPSWIL